MAARSQSRNASLAEDLSNVSILGYLSRDSRPAFVVRLHSEHGDETLPFDLAFCNDALRDASTLFGQVVQAFNSSVPPVLHSATLRAFRSWIFSVSVSAEELARASSASYFGISWTSVRLNSRYVVFNGTSIQPQLETLERMGKPIPTIGRYFSSDRLGHHDATAAATLYDGAELVELGGLSGNSELHVSDHIKFLRQFDWTCTPVGPIELWPPQLRQTVDLALANPDPVVVFWGSENTMIYNEPYLVIAGMKHPALLGGALEVHFAEVWDQFEPMFKKMKSDGQAIKQENVPLLLNRRGRLEEGFFTFSLIPLLGENGSVVGIYETVLELTRQTLSERRMRLLLDVGERALSAVSVKDVWGLLLQSFGGHEADIPFAVFYRLDDDQVMSQDGSGVSEMNQNSAVYVLEGAVGSGWADPGPRQSWYLEDQNDTFASAFRSAGKAQGPTILHVRDHPFPEDLFRMLSGSGFQDPCEAVAICPLSSNLHREPRAYLVIGISAKRPCDDDCWLFLQLLSRQAERLVTSVKLFEEEKARIAERAAYEQETLSLQLELRTREAEENELRFKRFAERSSIGISILAVDGSIKFCNDAWYKISGHPKGQSLPMSWTQVIHPDDAEMVKRYWDRLVNLEGPQTFECRLLNPWRPPTGAIAGPELDYTWVLNSSYVETSEEGKVNSVLGCITDISHQKWAEDVQSQRLSEALELKRQQENFMDITSHEIRNPLNAILHCATELLEVLGELRRMRIESVQFNSAIHDCLEASGTIVYCGQHQKRIVDDVLTLSKLDSDLLSVSPLETRPTALAEQVLKIYETELRAANIQFALVRADSYAMHEIDVLLLDPHRVIQILINLTANAIKFTKGKSVRALEIVLGASLEKPNDATKGPVRYVPTGRSRKDPTLQPEWGAGQVIFLHLSVRDTGLGMTPEESNILFNRFTQASPRTHAQYGGSGLGLFISRELAELHGGAIGLSSQLGVGSTFDFYVKARRPLRKSGNKAEADLRMPQAAPQTSARGSRDQSSEESLKAMNGETAEPSIPSHQQDSNQGSVLIVEDNLVNQTVLAKMLRKQGYAVAIANDGEEALLILQKSSWWRELDGQGIKLDVIISDIEMPRMDGKELARKIRELQKSDVLTENIPVIAVTGNARTEQMKAALSCGFDDVVSKPYAPSDIIMRLKKFTQKPQ